MANKEIGVFFIMITQRLAIEIFTWSFYSSGEEFVPDVRKTKLGLVVLNYVSVLLVFVGLIVSIKRALKAAKRFAGKPKSLSNGLLKSPGQKHSTTSLLLKGNMNPNLYTLRPSDFRPSLNSLMRVDEGTEWHDTDQ